MKYLLSILMCIVLFCFSACTSLPTTGNQSSHDSSSQVVEPTQKTQLSTPTGIITTGDSIIWDQVPNAIKYEIKILPNNVTFETQTNFAVLTEYYLENTELYISIRAIADANSIYINSDWSSNVKFEIPTGTMATETSVGRSINLLTGTHTELLGLRIFDETILNRLSVETIGSDRNTFFSSSMSSDFESYLNQIGINASKKIGSSVSIGIPGLAKITAGYDFSIGASYEKKSFESTSVLFYDAQYRYQDRTVSLKGLDDISSFSQCLSTNFIDDAQKVANGLITPETFINRYGSNIITEAIYGATVDFHYELITDESTVTQSFGVEAKTRINSTIDAVIKGINVGVGGSTETSAALSLLTNSCNKNQYSKLDVATKGGPAAPIPDNNPLEGISGIYDDWTTGINEDNCALIDVPDGSLYFVWDFLDDSFAETKEILSNYFLSKCEESYNSLRDKLSDMYSEEYFDSERGILTFDLNGLQNENLADLSNSSINNFDKNILTIYPSYNYIPIQKVVFKGRYGKMLSNGDKAIDTYFNNFAIKFSSSWENDIVIEFKDFAFEAPSNTTALDFSETKSSNISILITNKVKIIGGSSSSADKTGSTALNASNKNLSLIGNNEQSSIEIFGGQGANGSNGATVGDGKAGNPGKNGGAGGIGLTSRLLNISNLQLTVSGGNGGNGGNGSYGNGALFSGALKGGNGGNGGTGGNALVVSESKNFNYSNSSLTLKGGTGGVGGNGGNGSEYGGNNGKGGNAGNGGNGGNALFFTNFYQDINESLINLQGGAGGKPGKVGINRNDSSKAGEEGNDGLSGAKIDYTNLL